MGMPCGNKAAEIKRDSFRIGAYPEAVADLGQVLDAAETLLSGAPLLVQQGSRKVPITMDEVATAVFEDTSFADLLADLANGAQFAADKLARLTRTMAQETAFKLLDLDDRWNSFEHLQEAAQ